MATKAVEDGRDAQNKASDSETDKEGQTKRTAEMARNADVDKHNIAKPETEEASEDTQSVIQIARGSNWGVLKDAVEEEPVEASVQPVLAEEESEDALIKTIANRSNWGVDKTRAEDSVTPKFDNQALMEFTTRQTQQQQESIENILRKEDDKVTLQIARSTRFAF